MRWGGAAHRPPEDSSTVSARATVITLAARPSGIPPGGPTSCTDSAGSGRTRRRSRAKSLWSLVQSRRQRPCALMSLVPVLFVSVSGPMAARQTAF